MLLPDFLFLRFLVIPGIHSPSMCGDGSDIMWWMKAGTVRAGVFNHLLVSFRISI